MIFYVHRSLWAFLLLLCEMEKIGDDTMYSSHFMMLTNWALLITNHQIYMVKKWSVTMTFPLRGYYLKANLLRNWSRYLEIKELFAINFDTDYGFSYGKRHSHHIVEVHMKVQKVYLQHVVNLHYVTILFHYNPCRREAPLVVQTMKCKSHSLVECLIYPHSTISPPQHFKKSHSLVYVESTL